MATLDWTVSPRFEAGYRLPSGFGEIDVSYRFLLTEGAGNLPAGSLQGPMHGPRRVDESFRPEHGRRRTTPPPRPRSPCWDRTGPDEMADRPAGRRTCSSLPRPTSLVRRPPETATGIENNFWGIGPHAGCGTAKPAATQGPGMGRQARHRAALWPGPSEIRAGRRRSAPGTRVDFENWQQVPMLSGFLGLDWRPASLPNLDLLLGYTAEYWWNVGRLSDPDIYDSHSAGEVGIQGAVLRLEYNY